MASKKLINFFKDEEGLADSAKALAAGSLAVAAVLAAVPEKGLAIVHCDSCHSDCDNGYIHKHHWDELWFDYKC